MEDLEDYSGEFRRNLRLDDFSKAALVRLWQAAGKLYVGLDGIWYSLIRERFGEDMARELDAEVWRRETALEVGRVREALNIWGDDVASVLKFIQTDPGGGAIFPEFECELKDKNYGILTIRRCLGLEYYERHGEREMQKHACEVLDVEGFQAAAGLFSPRIKVRALKLPPRKSADEIACQWEFRLGD